MLVNITIEQITSDTIVARVDSENGKRNIYLNKYLPMSGNK